MNTEEFKLNKADLRLIYKTAVLIMLSEADVKIDGREFKFVNNFQPFGNMFDERVPAISCEMKYAPMVGYSILRSCMKIYIDEHKETVFTNEEMSSIKFIAKKAMPDKCEYATTMAVFYK